MVLSTCWNISQLLPKYFPKLKIIWLPFRNRFNGQWLFCGFIVTGNLKFNEPTNKKYSKLPAACSSFTFPNASPIPDTNGCCLNIKTSQFTNCAKLIALCKLNDLQTDNPHCHFIQDLWNSFFHTNSGAGQMPHLLPYPVQSSSLTVSHAIRLHYCRSSLQISSIAVQNVWVFVLQLHVRVITGLRPDKSDIDSYEPQQPTACQQSHKETLNVNPCNIIQENNQANLWSDHHVTMQLK